MEIPATGRVPLVILVLLICSCSIGTDQRELAEYRRSPQTCGAEDYFAALPLERRLDYTLGALRVKPQARCILDLISREDLPYLAALRKRIASSEEIYDRLDFLEALKLKAERQELTSENISALSLLDLCSGTQSSREECHAAVATVEARAGKSARP